MRKKIFLVFMALFCTVFFMYGQRFQMTTGTPDQEDKWAVVEDPAINGYVAIGNAVQGGQSHVWISSYAPNGTVLTTAIAGNGREMIARDISIAPLHPVNGNTYYVTGWTDVGGLSQMFVGRIDLNGVFLWLEINPFLGSVQEMEGVALVTEPLTNDVIALGIAMNLGPPFGPQVVLGRFTAAGALVWSNMYAANGEWMPREIDLGPGTLISAFPGDFIITGEMNTTAGALSQTFAARYNGAGAEVWRNLYPAVPGFGTFGDAGYDVVLEPVTRNFCIVGVVQTGPMRPAATSTPYVLNVAQGGALIASSIYLAPGGTPMGLYPRCVSLGNNPGSVIFAGPDFANNVVFYGTLPTIAPPGAGLFEDFVGWGTANSLLQPFVLNDAQPEDILFTNLGAAPGYLISANANPVPFGLNDGHFIRTDLAGRTPALCPEKLLPHIYNSSLRRTPVPRTTIAIPVWPVIGSFDTPYPVKQDSCVDVCTVSSFFTYTKTGLTVNFTGVGTGSGTLSYSWDFGDISFGSGATTSHTYAGPGPYYACLTVTNYTATGDSCKATYCDSIRFCSVGASYTYTQSGSTVNFNGVGTGNGVVSYLWDFGDLSPASTLPNPVHIYAPTGPYTACLIVTNVLAPGDTCRDTVCHVISLCDVNASFTSTNSCKTVTFNNTSTGTGPFTYNWDFGDLNTSSVANPVHTYAACGNYTVRLIQCNAVCCDTFYQNVNIPCCTVASSFCVTTHGRSTTIAIDSSMNTGPGSYNYTVYLDGVLTTWTNPQNLTTGIHTICVKAKRFLCGDSCCATVCRTFNIADTCVMAADFWFQVQTNGAVLFTNKTTPATGNTYLWDFGGTVPSSTLPSPSVTFPAPGTYNVCLTVKRANGLGDTCEQKVCKTVVIDPPCKVKAGFKATYCLDSTKISFTNTSTGALTYEWDFGVTSITTDTSTQKDPIYTFPSTGTYIVCLKAKNGNNCWYRVCYKVIVSTVTTNNNCSVLPSNPTYRIAKPGEKPVVETELIAEEISSGNIINDNKQKTVEPSLPPGKLNLFPNPASQQVQAAFTLNHAAAVEVMVMNASGKLVYKKVIPAVNGKNQLAIPVQKLPNGIYLVRIKTGNQALSGNFFVDNR